jgi:hypothetical protein
VQIWLKGTTSFRVPVLPAEYNISSSHSVETVNINAIGEIDIGGVQALKSISFSSFFPVRYDSSYCEYSNLRPPIQCVDIIESMMNAPIKLIITGTNINISCRITSFEWGEHDGTGDISFTITFKEHKKIQAMKLVTAVVADSKSTDTLVREAIKEVPKTYTVKKGDNLSKIARNVTGSANWKPLYELNKNVIGSNPNLIYTGQVLTIPR